MLVNCLPVGVAVVSMCRVSCGENAMKMFMIIIMMMVWWFDVVIGLMMIVNVLH